MSIGDHWTNNYFNMGGNFINTTPNCKTWVNWSRCQAPYSQFQHWTTLHISVHDSLQKLHTSYIDILYVHWWDWDISVKEVMDSLHNLVASGKVIYLGVSDTPAWIVAQANQYAEDHGKTPFVVYQGNWNVMDRSFKRDIIPMARSLGKLCTNEEEQRCRASGEKGRTMTGDWERTEEEVKMSPVLEKKTPYVFPIIGGRKIENLKDNLEALDLTLLEEQIKELKDVVPFDVGFPANFIGDGSEPMYLLKVAMNMVRVPRAKALQPR
ncbi:NADP-dependent oxidoreductase domain-containing protein [Rhodocollybia butyracea]|uniref:NADP-dependent oxidoreductase domain-containing protein n=1 Tax=Rhodocollybia butyracea TaxID=206335 RepID=A0A9P5PD87_9AGAR|nr:NADP-dependent oxidoreductase domain-containing protein [Rhodocollybia butyracea]